MPEERRARARMMLGGLAVLAVAVGVLGARVLVDLGQGLRVLGGEEAATATPPSGVPDGAQAAEVDRVVDGDTIRVRVAEPGGPIPPAASVPVRLLNVDAPELDHPRRGRDCGAGEAAGLVEELAPAGTVVWLVADTEDRDHYGRALRAVFNHEGTFVNGELVRAGWARAVRFEPNDRFHGEVVGLEARARQQRRGAWVACGGPP